LDISVVHNFVCPHHFDLPPNEEFRQELSSDGAPILCHISNFRPVKRVCDVVDMFHMVRSSRKAKLLMVGDGPDRQAAEERARTHGIGEDVIFLGKVKNPIEALLISDLLVLPSETESFGLVALEAFAAGVPVVSSNTGGLPEVNLQDQTGRLRPVGDVAGMAQDALHILEESVHPTFKEAALKRAAEFQMENIVPQYLALYKKALQPST
jgi:N-acetyl-alpha-D-glucosaminyl L-malate synthase BshA